MQAFGNTLIVLALLALYWMPAIIAAIRGVRAVQVLLINLLLGWTGIGWIVALVMSAAPKQNRAIGY